MDSKFKLIPLDNSLKTPEARVELVTRICNETPPEYLTNRYLTQLSDYIIEGLPKKERLQHNIITKNRKTVLNYHETSYQGLAEKLEGGENSIYNMITDRGKEQYLYKKEADPFSPDIMRRAPELAALRAAIQDVEKQKSQASGRKAYLLGQQVIQMRQDQYVIRESVVKPVQCTSVTRSFPVLDLSENIVVTENGDVVSDGICSIYNPKHVAAVLKNYTQLKHATYGKFDSDAYYFMIDFTKLFEHDFKEKEPMLFDLAWMKINGHTNAEIQAELRNKYNILHSPEYLSTLWTKKIPAAVAALAADQYIDWYYLNAVKGKYKKCNRCGQIKLVIPRYFSKNKSSKDGFYSICKECRRRGNGRS